MTIMPTLTRAPLAALLLLVLAVLSGCSSAAEDEGGSASPPPADDASPEATAANDAAPPASEGAATVVVEHAFGETEVDGVPARIVTLGLQWTDVLLAMGVQPVGHVFEALAGETGIYPWQDALSADAVALDTTDGLPLEQIAALDPDLILVTYQAPDQATFDSLADIAPTIGLLGGNQVDPWQDQVAVAGELLGDPEGAQAVIDEVTDLVQQTATDLPGLQGRTFLLANYVPGDSIYVVADEEDGASQLFQDLGMVLEPGVVEVADDVSGRANLSLEQAGLLASDLLITFSNGAQPTELVGWDTLPAVQTGGAADVDAPTVVGLNTPTPLSIPFSLDAVRPALEAVAAAG